MGAMFDGMQRQMGELSLRVAAIESRPGPSGPPLLPYSDPRRLRYGMPGYGGIPALPASGPVISEILPTPPLPVPTTSLPVSPAVGSQPPQTGVPIQSIQFPSSPSPIPSLSSILHGPVYSSTTVLHDLPPRLHGQQQSEGDGESHGVPKYHKLSFPVYDGKEDPLGWLNRCESFFHGQLTKEADKVWLASFHMTGDAQQWYYIMERDTGRTSWENFRLLCHQRFGPALSTNHLADLARLPFTTNVDAYMSAFQARLAHAGRLQPLQQAQLFTGGLPEHIRIDVELHEPQDLHRAMRLARAYERRNATTTLALPAPSGRPPRRPAQDQGSQSSTGVSGSQTASSASSPRPFRFLTPAEISEHRKQGLCYNCDEPYVQGHKCKRLFYLEAADYIVEEPDDSDDDKQPMNTAAAPPTISLAAIAGIRTEDTMQVYV